MGLSCYKKKKTKKIQKFKNNGSGFIVKKREVSFAPRARAEFAFMDFF